VFKGDDEADFGWLLGNSLACDDDDDEEEEEEEERMHPKANGNKRRLFSI